MSTQLPLERFPTYGCVLGQLPLSGSNVASVVIEQDEFMHDHVQVKLRSFTPTGLATLSGLPMKVSLGWQNDSQVTISGYFTHADIDHHKAGESDTKNPGVLLHMLGATSIMQSGVSKVWQDRTATSVVQELVNSHQLAYSGDDSDFIWPLLSQTTETDWEMVVQLAKQVGFTVVPQNTVVRVFDPAALLRSAAPPPVFMTVGASTLPNVLSFNPRVGARSPDIEHAQRLTSFLSQDGEISTHVQDSPVYMGLGSKGVGFAYNRTTGHVVNSYAEAKVKGQADATTNMWTMSADMVAQGTATVHAGSIIRVLCPNADYAGLWYVQSARHAVTFGSYTTSMTLGKDAVFSGRAGGQVPHTFDGQQVPPASRLVGTRWVSSWR